jgi:hypothetical protein
LGDQSEIDINEKDDPELKGLDDRAWSDSRNLIEGVLSLSIFL